MTEKNDAVEIETEAENFAERCDEPLDMLRTKKASGKVLANLAALARIVGSELLGLREELEDAQAANRRHEEQIGKVAAQATKVVDLGPTTNRLDAAANSIHDHDREIVALNGRISALRDQIEGYLGRVDRDRTPLLNAALADARSRIEPVAEGSTATVRTKQGGSFSFNYASAEDVIKAATRALAESGVAFIPREFGIDHVEAGTYKIRRTLRLAHSSGDYIDTEQEWPAIVTQGRALDKAVAAADTGGIAYYLRSLLLIPRGTFDDVNADSAEENEARSRASFAGQRRRVADSVPAAKPPKGSLSNEARATIAKIKKIGTLEALAEARRRLSGILDNRDSGLATAFSEYELDEFELNLEARENELRELVAQLTEDDPAEAAETQRKDEASRKGPSKPGRSRTSERRPPRSGLAGLE